MIKNKRSVLLQEQEGDMGEEKREDNCEGGT